MVFEEVAQEGKRQTRSAEGVQGVLHLDQIQVLAQQLPQTSRRSIRGCNQATVR